MNRDRFFGRKVGAGAGGTDDKPRQKLPRRTAAIVVAVAVLAGVVSRAAETRDPWLGPACHVGVDTQFLLRRQPTDSKWPML